MLFSVKIPFEFWVEQKKKKEYKQKKHQKKHCDKTLNLYRFLPLICGLNLIQCGDSEVNMVKKFGSVEQRFLAEAQSTLGTFI